MERLKAFKYRLYPTSKQKVLLEKHFGAARWVYNWALARKIAAYAKDKICLSKFDLNKEITVLKTIKETAWLSEVNSQTLQSAVSHLDSAYTSFFRKVGKFPKFKSKKTSHKSAEFRQENKVNFVSHKVFINKFRKGIKCNFHREFIGEIRTVTVSKTPTGKYFASILVKEEVPEIQQHPLELDKALGLDLGIKSLVVTSENQIFDNPKALGKSLRKLARVQRSLAKKKLGSKNRIKAKTKVARVYEKITNQRKDNLHKISRQLVNENQVTTYCLEDLNINNMLKDKRLAKAISDASWWTFTSLLTYKASWTGKNVIKIGRFEPSSKTCDVCGCLNHDLKLSDREWTCSCGTTHDRDFLAARNIKNFAFHPQNLLRIRQDLPKFKPAEKPSLSGRSMKRETEILH